MTRFWPVLAAACAVLGSAGATVNVAWDPPAGVEHLAGYRVVVDGIATNEIAGATNTITTFTLAGGRAYTLNAYSIGTNGLVSEPSLPLVVNAPATPILRVNVQTTTNLAGPWSTFWRAELEIIP